jgi:hypothetical protein
VLASRARPARGAIEIRARPPDNTTAVVVNSLDYVYGHCVLKLLSGLHHLRDSVDVVMIVPKRLAWLVPSAAHTVIEVDQPLSHGDLWIDGLDSAVKRSLSTYGTIRIAPAPSQPRLSSGELALAAPGFAPSTFWAGPPAGPPQITLLLREDRLWIGRSRLSRRLGLTRVLPRGIRHRVEVGTQNRRYGRVVRRVLQAIPEAQFVAIGLGRTGRFPATVRDLRRTTLEQADELAWCAEYARSRVVIGIHGSHMLLPSALAGAVIDLLPEAKLPCITQDLITAGGAESDPKLALFRYRILPDRVAPGIVGDVIVSILRNAEFHYLNTIGNLAATGDGWPRTFDWQPVETQP